MIKACTTSLALTNQKPRMNTSPNADRLERWLLVPRQRKRNLKIERECHIYLCHIDFLKSNFQCLLFCPAYEFIELVKYESISLVLNIWTGVVDEIQMTSFSWNQQLSSLASALYVNDAKKMYKLFFCCKQKKLLFKWQRTCCLTFWLLLKFVFFYVE